MGLKLPKVKINYLQVVLKIAILAKRTELIIKSKNCATKILPGLQYNTTSHHLAKEMGNKSSSSSSGKQSAAEVMPSPEDLAAMKPAGQKAWKFRVDASQKIHSRSPFGRESRLEDASELAEKAATQFKLAKMYDEAAECYQMQAKCCERSQEPMSAAGALIQAGEVYGKHGNTENAFEVYHSAIELYKDGGKFDRAGKHQQALADVSLFAGRFPLLFSSFFVSL